MTERPDQSMTPRWLDEHPLDIELRLLGGQTNIQQRLEVIWRAYESATE